MGYSVKWVAEHLGITRDMLRYYEKEGLLSVDKTRNPSNKYRDYSEEDIKCIWSIKLLISIGFSAKEIRSYKNDPNFNFYDAISLKVSQLEKKHAESRLCLEFAKTIKMTGRMPNTTQVGNMKFDDFIKFSQQNWNAFSDPQGKRIMAMSETVLEKSPGEWDETDLQRITEILGDFEPEQLSYIHTISGYYRVIADMIPLGYEHSTVQNVVKLLYEYTLTGIEPKYREKFTPLFFADHTCSDFIESGFAEMNEKNYGKEGCMFIAKALAHFGGYNLEI